MPKYKALVVTENEDKSFTSSIEEKETKELNAGQVLVRVHYSCINYKDALSCKGNKGVTRKYPHTPGIDACGVVVESKTPLFEPSDEVIVTSFDLGMNTAGGFGEYIVVPFYWLVRKPAALSFKEAMVYGTAGLTAAISIDKCIKNGLSPNQGETLVTGATGGVGSIAVAILAKLGYSVIGLTRKKDKEAFLKKLGAKGIIGQDELISKRPLDKPRWAAVIDCVGGDVLANALKHCMHEAPVTVCGMLASANINSSIFPFILRGINLLGVDSQSYPIEKRQGIWDKLALDWKINMDGLYKEISLEQVDAEIELMIKGKQTGRVIIKLDK